MSDYLEKELQKEGEDDLSLMLEYHAYGPGTWGELTGMDSRVSGKYKYDQSKGMWDYFPEDHYEYDVMWWIANKIFDVNPDITARSSLMEKDFAFFVSRIKRAYRVGIMYLFSRRKRPAPMVYATIKEEDLDKIDELSLFKHLFEVFIHVKEDLGHDGKKIEPIRELAERKSVEFAHKLKELKYEIKDIDGDFIISEYIDPPLLYSLEQFEEVRDLRKALEEKNRELEALRRKLREYEAKRIV